MNALTLTGGSAASITSAEIAELVGSRHDSVKRTIERLANQGVIEFPPTVEIRTATNTGSAFSFSGDQGKRDSIVIVAQLSPEFTARLVDRWQELEKQAALAAFNIPKTMGEALRLAADAIEERDRLAITVQEQAPKVEFVDRYVEARGSKGFREVCKLLAVKEPEFRAFLFARGIVYRLNGDMAPHANHVTAGRFEVKAGISDGGHAFNQLRFTPKGIQWIASEWHRAQIAAMLAETQV